RLIGLLCMPARAPVPGCLLQPGQSYLLQSSLVANEARARSHGVELALDWRPLSTLRFQAALSQQSMSVQEKGSAFSTDREESAPEVQASLRAMWNPRSSVDVDFWLRRVGRLADVGAGVAIPAYTELDARLAWRPRKDVELALIGRNLLHRSHPEFRSELQDIPSLEVVRSVAGQVTWKF
ncbi:TonB-dependent receptor, partial [Accumulibacter sp.]